MSSTLPTDDLYELLRSMDEEALRSLATAVEEDPGSQPMVYAARRAIYEHTKADDDLDSAIQVVERLSPASAPGSSGSRNDSVDGDTLAQLQEEASGLARTLFERNLVKRHLDRALNLIQIAVQGTPDDDGDTYARRMRRLAEMLEVADATTYVHREAGKSEVGFTWTPDQLDQIIIAPDRRNKIDENTEPFNRREISSRTSRDPLRFIFQCSLRNLIRTQYEASPTEIKAEAAVKAAEDVVAAASQEQNAAQKPDALFNLGGMIAEQCERFEQKGTGNIDYGIECLRKAFDGLKMAHRQARCLERLSLLLYLRYLAASNLGDIRESVAVAERALGLSPDTGAKHDKERAMLLYNLNLKLSALNEAIGYVEVSPQEAAVRAQREMDTAKEASELLPPDDKRRRRYGACYAYAHRAVFRVTGDAEVLNRGIEFCHRLSHLGEVEGPEADDGYWRALMMLLLHRYLRTEIWEDISDATAAAQKALSALEETNIQYTQDVANLSHMLQERSYAYRQRPSNHYTAQARQDIDEAIRLSEKAVDRAPAKSQQRGDYMKLLASQLLDRMELLPPDQKYRELDRTLALAKEAETLMPESDIASLQARGVLAIALSAKAQSLPESIAAPHWAAAVSAMQATVRDTPDTSPQKAQYLVNLGQTLARRFEKSQADADLDGAIDAFESCSRCSSATSPSLGVRAALWAATLLVERKADFTRANGLLKYAVEQLRRVSPRSLRQADQQNIVRKFAGLATLAAATALEVGATAGDALAVLEEGRGVILGLLFEARSNVAALRANPQFTHEADEFERLRDALDSPIPGAAAAADDAPPITNDSAGAAVAASHGSPMTARTALASFAEPTRRERLAQDFEVLIKKIQGLEGFEDFMRTPPVTELQCAAAAGSIVVVNVSTFRCDAFIVHHDRDVELERLPGLRHSDIVRWSRALNSKSITEPEMFKLLAWLWDELAWPVLQRLEKINRNRAALVSRTEKNGQAEQGANQQDRLEELLRETNISETAAEKSYPAGGQAEGECPKEKPEAVQEKAKLPRVWWIPTGPLCALPIHAAGHYEEGAALPDTLLERALSSYSPSIRALLFAQRNRLRGAHKNLEEAEEEAVTAESLPPPRALVVAMEVTEDHATLGAARDEAKAVRDQLLSKQPSSQSTTTAIDVPDVLVDPDRAEVIRRLRDASLLHFAGHGLSHASDPLRSTLLLSDWKRAPLTVADLIDEFRRHERPRFLAYLSACSTGSSRADELADEGLHLMSACQLVGFQHVVGSLWEVSDGHCVEVARSVYAAVARAGGLFASDEAVARGVHDGARALRDLAGLGAAGFDISDHSRDGHSLTAARARRRRHLWRVGDPRLWAAYIHMGP